MCRWFGYRPRYEDLCRIYMSPINIMNFRAVVDAVEDLKDQFREMALRKSKPSEFGLMIKESPETLNTSLLITSRNKMYNSDEIIRILNYGGTYADTLKLYPTCAKNEKNINMVNEFFSELAKDGFVWEDVPIVDGKSSRHMIRNIDKLHVAKFIRKLQVPYENVKFDVDNLADYIEKSQAFPSWDLVIASGSSNSVKTFEGVRLVKRYYVRMEGFSRKLYAPLESGRLVQPLWFFERARGQYEQPMMQMTKKQKDDYKLVRPKDKKFTLTDLAKYMNAAAMLPYYVSWGGEVNAAHFHNNMVKQWNKDNTVFNELFYKELIGKKIMFAYIEHVISDQQWYQERRAYRPQIVAYTFSKLVYEAQRTKKRINYRQIWDNQKVSDIFETDIDRIGKLVFDLIYDENRSTANIETYCKKEECWQVIMKQEYQITENLAEYLATSAELDTENARAKKEQRSLTGRSDCRRTRFTE